MVKWKLQPQDPVSHTASHAIEAVSSRTSDSFVSTHKQSEIGRRGHIQVVNGITSSLNMAP